MLKSFAQLRKKILLSVKYNQKTSNVPSIYILFMVAQLFCRPSRQKLLILFDSFQVEKGILVILSRLVTDRK